MQSNNGKIQDLLQDVNNHIDLTISDTNPLTEMNQPNNESIVNRIISLQKENLELKKLYESVCLEKTVLQEALEGKL